MTNAMIITSEQLRLFNEGILHYTGKMIKVYNLALCKVEETAEIQPIHTYAHWKSMGYQVKKGEKAIAKFPIWKYTKGKKKEMTEEEAQEKGYCFMKISAFFSDEQVEPVE